MTKNEIYILNRALDGKQIYGFSDFKELQISELLVDLYKEGMIQRGILKDKNNLTKEGAEVVSKIKDYKECKSFVSLNNLTIGKNEEGKCVSLIYNPLYDEYKFTRVELPSDYTSILDSYSFLNDIEDNDINEVGRFSVDDMQLKFENFGKKDVLKIKKHNIDEDASYIIFTRNRQALLYDYDTGILYSVGKSYIQNRIKEELG